MYTCKDNLTPLLYSGKIKKKKLKKKRIAMSKGKTIFYFSNPHFPYLFFIVSLYCCGLFIYLFIFFWSNPFIFLFYFIFFYFPTVQQGGQVILRCIHCSYSFFPHPFFCCDMSAQFFNHTP